MHLNTNHRKLHGVETLIRWPMYCKRTNRIFPGTCYVYSVLQAHGCDHIHIASLCRSSCGKESASIIMAGGESQTSNGHAHRIPFERVYIFVRLNDNLTQGLPIHDFLTDSCPMNWPKCSSKFYLHSRNIHSNESWFFSVQVGIYPTVCLFSVS